MAYTKQDWKNFPDETTPITAERMNHIEDGIYENSNLDTEMSTISEKAVQNKTITNYIGEISNLNTTDKSNVVNAINETVDKARANKTFFLTSNYTINSDAVTPINESKISLKTNGGKILAIISAPVHGAGAGSPRMGISVDGVLKSGFLLTATQNVINSYSTIFDLEAGTHEFVIVMFKGNDSSVTFQSYLGSSLTIIEL